MRSKRCWGEALNATYFNEGLFNEGLFADFLRGVRSHSLITSAWAPLAPSIPRHAAGAAIAARTAGPTTKTLLGTRTLFRWLEVPEFRAGYLQARRQAFGQASARLQQATAAAVSVLLTLMLDANAPAATRARAAHSVLDLAKSLELEDLEVRLQRLEQIEHDKNSDTSVRRAEDAA